MRVYYRNMVFAEAQAQSQCFDLLLAYLRRNHRSSSRVVVALGPNRQCRIVPEADGHSLVVADQSCKRRARHRGQASHFQQHDCRHCEALRPSLVEIQGQSSMSESVLIIMNRQGVLALRMRQVSDAEHFSLWWTLLFCLKSVLRIRRVGGAEMQRFSLEEGWDR